MTQQVGGLNYWGKVNITVEKKYKSRVFGDCYKIKNENNKEINLFIKSYTKDKFIELIFKYCPKDHPLYDIALEYKS